MNKLKKDEDQQKQQELRLGKVCLLHYPIVTIKPSSQHQTLTTVVQHNEGNTTTTDK